MSTTQAQQEKPKVYWMPGCTSCLNTKEYLKRHKIEFESRNVAADPGAYDELARFGLKRIPIVVLGDKWADGQILSDVAKLVGIKQTARTRLSPAGALRPAEPGDGGGAAHDRSDPRGQAG